MSSRKPENQNERANPWADRLIAARNGSQEELGAVFAACRNYLLMIAHAEVGPALRAKAGDSDVVQDSLIEIQHGLPKFRGSNWDEFLGWAAQILRNNIADLARRYRDTQQRDLSREVPLHANGEYAHDSPNPAVRIEKADSIERIREHIANLTPLKRRVLELRIQEHLGWDEIGARLKIEPEYARKLWFRAVEDLRIRMGAQHDSAGNGRTAPG